LPATDLPLLNTRPRLRVDGQDRANLGEAVLALSLHLPRSGMAAAELRLLNWSGASGTPDFLFQDLRHGQRLDILLGEDATDPAFSGAITAIEERYGHGAPQIVLLAEDALHLLARRRDNRAFEDMGLGDVVQQVARGAGLAADVAVPGGSATWLQNNESDLAFLQRQLGPLDIAVRLQGGQLRVRDEETDPHPVALHGGSNATQIRLVADLARQPVRVSSLGLDLDAAADTSGDSSALSPAPAGPSAAALLDRLSWPGGSTPPHPFSQQQGQADALAERRFRAAAQRFVHGDIVCIGTPELRSGRQVELSEVSARLAGRYRVDDCLHLFDSAQGLRTRLRVSRPDWSV
jgi:phage protein D